MSKSHFQITLLISRNAPSDHHCVTTKCRDPMAIYFTSGTTGSPKMAEHSHGIGIGFTVSGRYSYPFKSDTLLSLVTPQKEEKQGFYQKLLFPQFKKQVVSHPQKWGLFPSNKAV